MTQVDYRKIQKLDFFRNLTMSALIPLVEVVFMLFMIKVYQANTFEKTLLTILAKSSYLLGIPLSVWVFRNNINIGKAIGYLYFFSASALILIANLQWVWGFLALVVLIGIPYQGMHGLTSEFYNFYPKTKLGRSYVILNLALYFGGILFALLFEYLLTGKSLMLDFQGGRDVVAYINQFFDAYEVVFYIVAIALVVAGGLSFKLPQIRFSGKVRPSIRKWVNLLWNDKPFLYVSIAWTFLGIANLWLVFYRTNILVEPEFDFNYSESEVFLLLALIPGVTYLIFNYPIAYFFDHYNIIVLRIMINIFMGLYIGFFFMSTSFYGLVLGSVFYGLFTSGGNIAWKLWVYKAVPQDSVSTYMNIHTALTGIRVMISPMFGLYALYEIGSFNAALISLVLLAISTTMLVFLIPKAYENFIY